MQRGTTGHHRAAERPTLAFRHQFCADRIGQHVETNPRKGTAFPLILTQHMVVGLVLEPVRPEHGRQLATEKSHGIELVTFASHSHPDEMYVVRHQTISRTPNVFTNRRVQYEFSKTGMKRVVQPAGRAMFHGQRPQGRRMALVMMAQQPWQIVLLFNRPVHFHRSRVCENAEFFIRQSRPRFHKRGYTSFFNLASSPSFRTNSLTFCAWLLCASNTASSVCTRIESRKPTTAIGVRFFTRAS